MEKKEEDISIEKLVTYNLYFFIPLLVAIATSYWLSLKISPIISVSTRTGTEILMIFFSIAIFLYLIPHISKRESVKGVRFSMIAILLIGFFMSLPSAIVKKDFSLLFSMLTYLGSYVLLTFIFCPEVLGLATTVSEWFKKKRQFSIVLVYGSIVLLYVMGFGWLFYEIALFNNDAFSYYNPEGIPTYPTMLYYSIVTFASLGYGDISPVLPGARLVATIEAILGLTINVLFIALILVYISNILSQTERKEEKEMLNIEKKLEREVKSIKSGAMNVTLGKKKNHNLPPDPDKIINL